MSDRPDTFRIPDENTLDMWAELKNVGSSHYFGINQFVERSLESDNKKILEPGTLRKSSYSVDENS